MPTAAHSFARVIEVFMGAIIVTTTFGTFSSVEGFPGWIKHVLILGSIVGTLVMVRDMQYWNHEYTLGWILCLPFVTLIMLESGIISVLDILLYTRVTIPGVNLKYLADSSSRKRVMV